MKNRILAAFGRLSYVIFYIFMACAYTYAIVGFWLMAGKPGGIKTPPCTIDASSSKYPQNGRCIDDAWSFHAQPIDWMIGFALMAVIFALIIRYAPTIVNTIVDGIYWLVGDLFDPIEDTDDAAYEDDTVWAELRQRIAEEDRMEEEENYLYAGNTL